MSLAKLDHSFVDGSMNYALVMVYNPTFDLHANFLDSFQPSA